mmetsp:Transcript_26538/g.32113  ORF Transcript_26538/g.32113 Transcript_26538/m.32113 type:complete len:398 (-) Transcript_26538:156-1349(-)|eukprot:CAMPEP_0172516578 /NCGR_PEP_ID=MMETSP1066-20121228/277221_1 /TAXON_ID=671091 /ORGANISM="Coscinodiscus wailesii, Strain CCMP2513" /LENGTH=397 /DNA_ID=CAMNT_0013298121 /DNA_START=103 /DNA_END=1296 /DNA_ORIENTATION=+
MITSTKDETPNSTTITKQFMHHHQSITQSSTDLTSSLPSSASSPCTCSTSDNKESLNKQKKQEHQQQQQRHPLILSRKDTVYTTSNPIHNAIAGACAGAFARTAVAPVERIKLLMQLGGSIEGGVVRSGASAWSVAKGVYTDQGLLAFWRGNTPNVLRQAGTSALNFMLMDRYKTLITPVMNYTLSFPSHRTERERRKRRSLLKSFLSGGLAGGTTTTVLYPAEFLRTRLALDLGGGERARCYPNGMRDVFSSTLKSDGVKGLYQGYGIALSGVVVYRALHLGGYDAVKTEVMHGKEMKGERKELEMWERFLIAQVVSLVAGTMCYPIDSVKRRLMMQAGQTMEMRQYKNSIDCFKKVWASEGMKGFYLGIGPNILRSFGGALLLVAYDVFKGMGFK